MRLKSINNKQTDVIGIKRQRIPRRRWCDRPEGRRPRLAVVCWLQGPSRGSLVDRLQRAAKRPEAQPGPREIVGP
eukprot:scaffold157743_cov18-Prasinocladus_malaysianus.AAC.1